MDGRSADVAVFCFGSKACSCRASVHQSMTSPPLAWKRRRGTTASKHRLPNMTATGECAAVSGETADSWREEVTAFKLDIMLGVGKGGGSGILLLLRQMRKTFVQVLSNWIHFMPNINFSLISVNNEHYKHDKLLGFRPPQRLPGFYLDICV